MNAVTEKYLKQLLEGYENNIPNVDAMISDGETKINHLKEQREVMLEAIEELRELIVEDPDLVEADTE